MNFLDILSSTWLKRKNWALLILFAFLICWLGIPTYRKWKADNLVDELCAKDGGIKIYETVTLSASMFNAYGQPKIRFEDKAALVPNSSETGLYFTIVQQDIVGKHGAKDISKLIVWKSITQLHRVSDGKVLGETIRYTRSGGDPIGPWHPSSYSCPDNAGAWDLTRKLVIKRANDIGGIQWGAGDALALSH